MLPYLISLIVGAGIGSSIIWLLYYKSYAAGMRKAAANTEAQRIQNTAQISHLQQKCAELTAEITQKNKQINELAASE